MERSKSQIMLALRFSEGFFIYNISPASYAEFCGYFSYLWQTIILSVNGTGVADSINKEIYYI